MAPAEAVAVFRTMLFPSFKSAALKWILLSWLLLAGVAVAGQAPAWLLLSPTRDDAVMTLGTEEKEILLKAGWVIEGTGAVQTELVPQSALLHRMIRKRPEGIDRMLESDETKLDARKQSGFVDEGLLGYVAATAAPDRIAVVQFSKGERRLWLMNAQSQKAAEASGWKREGIQFWLWPVSAPAETKRPNSAPVKARS